LRVWGGGIYQQDDFYNLMDELGMMVWQEFIFACALYPNDAAFFENVVMEVRDQICRLQYHPSIVLWSGNNENEAVIADNWYGIDNPPLYTEMYAQLYFDTLLANLSVWDTSRPVLPSSPSNGDETRSNAVEADYQSPWKGDVHFYDYLSDCWNTSSFPRTRFASEYGFQSFPSFLSMSAVSDGSLGDWDYDSEFTLHRQHHPNGNDEIMTQIQYHYSLPNSSNSKKKYADTLWLTQVMHAQCMKSETEHYRRIRNECDETQSGCTMGTLYWQANDIWQGASWASLEYGGRWKMLQYFAKQFYTPVLVSMWSDGNNVAVYLVNDMTTPISGTLTFTMWSWSSNTPLHTWSVPVSQTAQNSHEVVTSNIPDLLKEGKCPDANECVITFRVTDNTGAILSQNHYYLASPKDVPNFADPELRIVSVYEVSGNPEYAHTFTVVYQSQALAAYVWLESSLQGHFSDNGFLHTPESNTALFFYTRDSGITPCMLEQSLTISSLLSITS